MIRILKQIATLGFIGYLPFAPGTFGSLAACAIYVLLRPPVSSHVLFLFFMIPLGVLSSHHAEILLGEKDSGHIVIDEFCGYFVSVLFIPFSIWHAVSAFFLFRFFDILKPFPIKNIEKRFKGGLGIVADDIMAGIYANAALQIWHAMGFQ